MTALQLDLYAPDESTGFLVRPGLGRLIESTNGAWRARYTGDRWGWCLYRNTTTGWESWEPNLPYGTSHIQTRDEAVQILTQEIRRHGDTPLRL